MLPVWLFLLSISIHALREEGDSLRPVSVFSCYISIHALREEGDTQNFTLRWHFANFYPRPPRGGRLDQQAEIDSYLEISIHALREEGDQC